MYEKNFQFYHEDRPGDNWRERFLRDWPETKLWYLQDGIDARPTRVECEAAFDRHLPELKPMWQHLCGLVGDGDLESRSLSCWSPPNIFAGCSVAVTDQDGPVLIRNYDFDPKLTGTHIVHSRWGSRSVIGLNEGGWGLLDGMNDDGLAACITFGGRPVCGDGFSVILVLRYLLETCRNAAEAQQRLLRLNTSLQQNIVVLDADGDHFTAMLAPDRDTRIWHTSVTTNHPETVEWPEDAQSSKTVERFDYLSKQLGAGELTPHFMRAPLYGQTFSGGMGTIYTASYYPSRGEAVFSWPNLQVTQSFDEFDECSVHVTYTDGAAAQAQLG